MTDKDFRTKFFGQVRRELEQLVNFMDETEKKECNHLVILFLDHYKKHKGNTKEEVMALIEEKGMSIPEEVVRKCALEVIIATEHTVDENVEA